MNTTHHRHRDRQRTAGTVLAGVLALLLAATGCSSKADGGDKGGEAADGVRTGPGVGADTIRLGALTDLTGPYATLGKSIVQAQRMWAEETNAQGGICDRKVEIVVKDHGYDVQKAVTAYADIAPDVVALPQVIGSPVVAALLDDIERDKMLTFPQAWAASLLGKDAIQVLGTTYDVDMIAAVEFLTRDKGLKSGDRIGHVYFEGDYGANALEGSTWAAGKAGLKVTGLKIKATDTDLSAQVSALRKEGVKAVLISAGPAQTASLVGVAASRGLSVPVVSSAPGFAPQLMKTPAAPALAAMLNVVSAAPAVSSDLPGVRRMVASYRKKYPDSPVDSGVLSGYNAAQLMGADLKKACEAGGLTREDVVEAHRSQKNADTGLGTAQNFSDVDRPASVETYVLKPDAKAVGGVVNAQEAHTAPGVEDYLSSR
ncbi:ABC transporter substrate-binding protein [Streptomyces griseoloalbus]|uniref:ABC-type branched-subunit amino acid transport system substrate-binding protein n=1 Tax=Streptomyces griseoloalbus TaxID=67303 RepID=A0A7W8BMC5_9ACTN|nr:ABC transporter substrate-binding protein [Streptomyces albaduncus]MBB5126036.1 ABC-type branched-subunit amino acid transport system substrate-binding protein [Streptomyces albaduncus]GGV63736.1 lipoprotein [Streptomyces griseoloalbus]GGW49554.1 lipoprotein [Streptomyces albaduncus]